MYVRNSAAPDDWTLSRSFSEGPVRCEGPVGETSDCGNARGSVSRALGETSDCGNVREFARVCVGEIPDSGHVREVVGDVFGDLPGSGHVQDVVRDGSFPSDFQSRVRLRRSRESEGRASQRTFQDVPTWRRAEVGQAQEVASLGSWELTGRANAARPRVLHVSGKHPDVCINGVHVDSFNLPDSRAGTCVVKQRVRDLNESALVRSGNSNVLLVRGSFIAGRRCAKVSVVMRDMVASWLNERWPVIVYIGNGRRLGGGLTEKFSEVGLPPIACCSCSLGPPGRHKFGVIHYNVPGLGDIIPKCVNCREEKHAVDGHWERDISQWIVQ